MTVLLERHDDAIDARALAEDVLDGLTRPFKELPPKWFYDAHGSALFDLICEQPEYYPTRTERGILEDSAIEIAEVTRAAELVELGSGAATKARLLLDGFARASRLPRYVPVDVSEVVVHESARALAREHPGLEVHGIVADFERHLDLLPAPRGARAIALLGGTIGNFTPGSRRRFLRAVAGHLGHDGHLLLGTDLVKDRDVLEAAYDDAAGITAAFNRNVLSVINRSLDADFDVEAFEHVAFFDAHHEWIEMRLRARSRQRVRIAALDLTVDFAAREEVRTEISAKFTRERVEADLAAAGLRLVRWLSDPDAMFAVTLARPA